MVADEAASLSPELVDRLLALNLPVLLASTVHGYEGTGRTLADRLLAPKRKAGDARPIECNCVHMETPIRYAAGCPVEAWLTRLLLLDAEPLPPPLSPGRPEEAQLLWVNRDALFGGTPATERFLAVLWSMLLAQDTRTDTDYLLTLADNPFAQLWVLCRQGDVDRDALPRPLAVILGEYNGALIGPESPSSVPTLFAETYSESSMAQLSGLLVTATAVAQGLTNEYLSGAVEQLVACHALP